MAISSIGVGSGLPIDDLLSQLQENENLALQPIADRKAAAQARLSAYGTLKSAIESLHNATKGLTKADETFGALKATLTGGEAVAVDVDPSAIAGQYSIDVASLATSQTLVAGGREKRDEAIGAGGTITITLANNETRTLELGDDDTSIDGLIAAINADPGLGVQATVVNDGSGQPYRLMLTAAETGTQGAVARIQVDGNADLQDMIGFDAGDPAASNLDEQAATDAELTINGTISVTSSTNEIEDVIQGVKLTLSETTEGPVTLKVARDPTVAKDAITSFVNAYNTLQSTIKNLTAFDVDAMTSQPLTGDSTARSAQTNMASALNVAMPEGTIRTLSQLGITTDPLTGKLLIDDQKLGAALDQHPEEVAKLFTAENGVASQVESAYQRLAGDNGMVQVAQDAQTSAIKDLDDQSDAVQTRIDATMEMYRQQFINLDSMMAQMNSLSSYLTTQLSMLSNLGSQGNSKK